LKIEKRTVIVPQANSLLIFMEQPRRNRSFGKKEARLKRPIQVETPIRIENSGMVSRGKESLMANLDIVLAPEELTARMLPSLPLFLSEVAVLKASSAQQWSIQGKTQFGTSEVGKTLAVPLKTEELDEVRNQALKQVRRALQVV
jgi:hypothetical protein